MGGSKGIRIGDLRVAPGRKARLGRRDADDTGGFHDRNEAEAPLKKDLERLSVLQERLFAEDRRALLVVFQAMDTGGKDGAIRHVFSGVNPAGCQVTRFKAPSAEELDHDFLWRIHQAVPNRGTIGIFNRSHYEDVLVVRVHNLVPPSVWRGRYEQINRFERHLSETGTRILKFFLHISKAEQRRRLQARLDDPDKRWKFSRTDLQERKRWSDYQSAYEDALTKCSTPWAPWHVVPADHKWYRNLAVARTLVEALEEMAPRPPRPRLDLSQLHLR